MEFVPTSTTDIENSSAPGELEVVRAIVPFF